jgi:uncharacterized protein (DUF1697 family)
MPALRALYEGLGATEVSTYIQSGNVILASDEEPAALSLRAAAEIEAALGLRIRVLGRSHAALARLVRDNPFPAADDRRHHVAFLDGPIAEDGLATLERLAGGGEEFAIVGGELHLFQPDGMGRSKLGLALNERQLGVAVTARNWRTVVALRDLSRPRP